jgi:hypothetical protein
VSGEQSAARAELRREKACESDVTRRAHAGGVPRQLQGGVGGAGEQGSEGGGVAPGAGAMCTENIGERGVDSVYGEEDGVLGRGRRGKRAGRD